MLRGCTAVDVLNCEEAMEPFPIPSTDYVVPPGEGVGVPISFMNYDPAVHENALSFDPDRYLRDPESSRPERVLQFGAGVHRCAGYVQAVTAAMAEVAD